MRMLVGLCLVIVAVAARTSSADDVDFGHDIRPILSDKCYACHGPDQAERQGGDPDLGGLHFDTKEGAFTDLGGYFAIVPGKLDESHMIRRINSTDPDEVMPPADHPKKLSAAEKQLLADWIKQGANWKDHWAYVPPQRQPAPKIADTAWPRNFIDSFIAARLEKAGLAPSPDADRRTLLRRLNFDLVGLPPTPDEVEAFLSDALPEAYEKVVDRLLASPHYGERMAILWLDLVRYADTVGYHGDQPISVSPYRDYVIEAFNANMPFDRFTREQLAGDLLPDATRDQRIASGYNRLGMMSAEGGVQPKEYLAKYASDRVRTASSVWLGSTLGCAECHDHKFDPFQAKDFYRFASFFADIKERGLYGGAHDSGDWGPRIDVPDERYAELVAPIERQLAELEKIVATSTDQLAAAQEQWEKELPAPTEKDKANKLPDPVQKVLAVAAAERNDEQRQALAAYYRSIAPALAPTRQEIEALKKQKQKAVDEHLRTSLVTASVEPRTMRVLARGNWMDDSGEVVEPGVPHFLRQVRKDGRAGRLDLADWLTARDNPLTARVFVNRLWKICFGAGLSKVLDDLGAQGEPPTHPALLDTLAVEFMDSGWDVKHLVKLIVMSSTYRQSSLMRDELKRVDPYNRLLARQSRFRLGAELIRDNALAVSGLLVRAIGGRSAKPYQPDGLYRHLNFPPREYEADTDHNQYRRGLYTHWQRQFLHPAMKAFDAPPREECTAERPRSNTPLAALVLLNDPSQVEAARVFAEKVLRHGGRETPPRLAWMFAHALSREPNEKEGEVLVGLLNAQIEHYRGQPAAAAKLVQTGLSPVPQDLGPVEWAAWTSVARAIFNTHEFITRN